MASLRAASRVGAVIPKCRHQSTATVINAAADEALPFEEVPTFKSTKWPFVGQIPELMKVEPELYKKDGFAKGYKLMNSVRGDTHMTSAKMFGYSDNPPFCQTSHWGPLFL